MLKPGEDNSFGALLGTYKWGYTDLWCNLTGGSPSSRLAFPAVLFGPFAGPPSALLSVSFSDQSFATPFDTLLLSLGTGWVPWVAAPRRGGHV